MVGGVMCRYLQQEICVQSAKRRCMHRFHFVANTFSVKTVCLNGMLFCPGSFKLSSTCSTVYVHMRLLNHGIVPALRPIVIARVQLASGLLWVHVKHSSKPKGLKKKGHELYAVKKLLWLCCCFYNNTIQNLKHALFEILG